MAGFDDHVISMYARGMSMREIQGHLLELCGTEVSPDLISSITDEVLEEVAQWQQRPLEPMYLIVYFDALPENPGRGHRQKRPCTWPWAFGPTAARNWLRP